MSEALTPSGQPNRIVLYNASGIGTLPSGTLIKTTLYQGAPYSTEIYDRFWPTSARHKLSGTAPSYAALNHAYFYSYRAADGGGLLMARQLGTDTTSVAYWYGDDLNAGDIS